MGSCQAEGTSMLSLLQYGSRGADLTAHSGQRLSLGELLAPVPRLQL